MSEDSLTERLPRRWSLKFHFTISFPSILPTPKDRDLLSRPRRSKMAELRTGRYHGKSKRVKQRATHEWQESCFPHQQPPARISFSRWRCKQLLKESHQLTEKPQASCHWNLSSAKGLCLTLRERYTERERHREIFCQQPHPVFRATKWTFLSLYFIHEHTTELTSSSGQRVALSSLEKQVAIERTRENLLLAFSLRQICPEGRKKSKGFLFSFIYSWRESHVGNGHLGLLILLSTPPKCWAGLCGSWDWSQDPVHAW